MKLREKIGSKIIPLQADFTYIDSTIRLADTFAGEQAPTHFVHMPAVSLETIKFHNTNWEMFDKDIQTAYRSCVILAQTILPVMAKRKQGKIVIMLSHSVMNQPPIKYSLPYTATKYALLGLLRNLAAEYAGKKVTVNAVSPSMTETRFLENVPELMIQQNAAASPIGRNLFPKDITSTFEFLLSNGADCITGQNIGITAGN